MLAWICLRLKSVRLNDSIQWLRLYVCTPALCRPAEDTSTALFVRPIPQKFMPQSCKLASLTNQFERRRALAFEDTNLPCNCDPTLTLNTNMGYDSNKKNLQTRPVSHWSRSPAHYDQSLPGRDGRTLTSQPPVNLPHKTWL